MQPSPLQNMFIIWHWSPAYLTRTPHSSLSWTLKVSPLPSSCTELTVVDNLLRWNNTVFVLLYWGYLLYNNVKFIHDIACTSIPFLLTPYILNPVCFKVWLFSLSIGNWFSDSFEYWKFMDAEVANITWCSVWTLLMHTICFPSPLGTCNYWILCKYLLYDIV